MAGFREPDTTSNIPAQGYYFGEHHSTPEPTGKSLAGKVALITGGSREVGASVVTHLSENEVTVIAGYHNKSKSADTVSKKITPFGNQHELVSGDIKTDEGRQSLFESVDR